MSERNFHEDLANSNKEGDLPIWEMQYRKFFPKFEAMTCLVKDKKLQSIGVDRIVELSELNKQIRIDEKLRYGGFIDILLEFISNDKTDAPGWICKPLLAEYIHYVMLPIGRELQESLLRGEWIFENDGSCKSYLLPVLQLQAAWMRHGEEWIQKYGTVPSKNKGYQTINCPIPVNVLFCAMGECLREQFGLSRKLR